MASRKTPEQRLAERGAAAGMTGREVRAIRCALDLHELLQRSDEFIIEMHDDLDSIIDALEADQEQARAATKAVGK